MENESGEIREPKFRRPTLTEKRLILERIYKEDEPAEKILKEFHIKTPAHLVLPRWEQQLKRSSGRLIRARKTYTTEFKQDVVRQIVLGAISEKEAIVKYGVSELQQIKNWIKKYSSQINYVSKNIVMKETEQSELATILQQKKELEKVLEEANLRIIGLDTLIDVAEKQFNIEIRKKAGTKQ